MTAPYPLLPGAVAKPVSYRGGAGLFPHRPLGWVLHVVVGNGSPYRTFEDAVSPHRRFSHAWVAKDGSSEQYTDLLHESWAQVAGNGTWWSFETEGFPDEPLTAAQIDTLARWHNYLHAADVVSHSPSQAGIGTHFMGGAAWGGHSCPDPVGHEGHGPRSLQRAAIIARARALRAVQPGPTPPPRPAPDPGTNVHHAAYTLHRTIALTRPWTSGDDVKHVQAAAGMPQSEQDGVYGPQSAHAVGTFQHRHGLVADEVVGPRTAAAMGFVWRG